MGVARMKWHKVIKGSRLLVLSVRNILPFHELLFLKHLSSRKSAIFVHTLTGVAMLILSREAGVVRSLMQIVHVYLVMLLPVM